MQTRGAKVESMGKLPSFKQYFMYPNLSVLSRSYEEYHMTNTLDEHSGSNLYQLDTVNIGCDDAENGPHRLLAKTCCNNVEPHCAEQQSRSYSAHNELQYLRQEVTGFDLQYAMISEESNCRKRSYSTMVHENSDASNSVLHDTEDLGCNGSTDETVYQALHTISDSTAQTKESALCRGINGISHAQTALQSQRRGAESYKLPCSDQDDVYNIDSYYASRLAPKDKVSSTSWNKICKAAVAKGDVIAETSSVKTNSMLPSQKLGCHKHKSSSKAIAEEIEKNLSLQAIDIQENNSKIQHRGFLNDSQLSQIRSSDFETFYHLTISSLSYRSEECGIWSKGGGDTEIDTIRLFQIDKFVRFILQLLPRIAKLPAENKILEYKEKWNKGSEVFIIENPERLEIYYFARYYFTNADNYIDCELQKKFAAYEDRLKKASDYAGRVNVFYAFLLEMILDKPDGSGYYTLKQRLWKVQIFMAEFLLYIGWLVKTINNVLMKSTEHKHCIKTEMTHIKNILEEYYRISTLSDINSKDILKMKEVVFSYRLHIFKLLESHHDNSAQYYLYKCALNSTQMYIKNADDVKNADILYILAFAAGTSSFIDFFEKMSKQKKARRTLTASKLVSDYIVKKIEQRIKATRILQLVILFLKAIRPFTAIERQNLNLLITLHNLTFMIEPKINCTSTIVRVCSGGEIMDYFHKQIYELFSG